MGRLDAENKGGLLGFINESETGRTPSTFFFKTIVYQPCVLLLLLELCAF